MTNIINNNKIKSRSLLSKVYKVEKPATQKEYRQVLREKKKPVKYVSKKKEKKSMKYG